MADKDLVEAEIVHNLPQEIAAEIGSVVVAFAKLEHKLTSMIGLILQLEKAEMRLALKDPRPENQLDIIVDLFLLKGIELATDTKDLRNKLEDAYNRRNKLAHSIWLKHPDSGDFFLRLTKGKWPQEKLANNSQGNLKRVIFPESTPYGIDDCREDLQAVEVAINLVDDLGMELDSLLLSFPDRFRPRLPLINPLGGHKPRRPPSQPPSSD